MKLYNIVLIFLMTVLFASQSYAQNLFAKLSFGYGFSPGATEFLDNNFSPASQTTYSGTIITYEKVNATYGKGIGFGGAVAYMFGDHIGAELGFSYLAGSKIKFKDIFTGGTTDYEYSASMLQMTPSIMLSAGTDGVNPYARMGLVIGMLSTAKYKGTDIAGGNIDIVAWKTSGGTAFGFAGAMGVSYDISGNIALFGEVQLTSLSWAPKKSSMTEFSTNGANNLPLLTTDQKEVEFVDSYTFDAANSPPASVPKQALQVHLPFYRLAINIGVTMNF